MRNLIAAITLMMVLTVGTTFAQKGLYVSDVTGSETNPCTDYTIVPTGFTTIVPTGFTTIVPTGLIGIIMYSKTETTTTNCTIVPTGK